ncbi:MAG: hypothetical protein ACK4E8_12505 [Lacibacter sp.]|jgi:hypothetical protein
MKTFATTLFTMLLVAGCKQRCSVLRNHPLAAFMFVEPNVERMKLGDSLRLKTMIPYKSIRQDNGEEIDVRSSSISTSGLDLVTYNLINSEVEITGNTFNIIPIKGSYTSFNHVMIRVSYVRDTLGFVFEAWVIPTQKGLANFANYKAEGWMNGKCELNVFSPIVGSVNKNHHLFRNLRGRDASSYIRENQYYVWVE